MLRLPVIFFLLLGLSACTEPPYTNVDNEALKALLAQGVPIYDIRRADEWRQTGVIEGSRKLTFVDAAGHVSAAFLPRFTAEVGREAPVILICRTGNRTDSLARYLMDKLAYTRVYNVKDGITQWIREKNPVVRE